MEDSREHQLEKVQTREQAVKNSAMLSVWHFFSHTLAVKPLQAKVAM